MKVHQRQTDCVAIILIAIASLFFVASADAQSNPPGPTDPIRKVERLSESEKDKFGLKNADEELKKIELPSNLRRIRDHLREGYQLAGAAIDYLEVCNVEAANKELQKLVSLINKSVLGGHREDSNRLQSLNDQFEEVRIKLRRALEECKKRAGNKQYQLEDSARRARHALENANNAVKACNRALFRAALAYLRKKADELEEQAKSLQARGARPDLVKIKLADAATFREQEKELARRETALFAHCLDDAKNVAGATPPAGGKQVKAETGGSAGRCVITEGGSIEELKVGEKPGGQTASPPKAPAPPTGQTAETPKTPAAPPEKKTAETPKTPVPAPEKKTAEIPTTPAEKKPPEKPSGGPTPEKTAGPPTGETTIFVKASDTVAFGNGAGTGPLAGAVVRLAGLGTTPALPQQGDARTAEAENDGASSSPTQCRTDDNGRCNVRVPLDEFDPPKQAGMPDNARVGVNLNLPNTSPATTNFELNARRNDSVGSNDGAGNPRVGVNFDLPNTSSATATLELNTRRNDSVVVEGATARPNAPRKQGRLEENDDLDIFRAAATNVLLASTTLPADSAGGVRLAQQPPKQDASSDSKNDEVRPPPGTEVTIERIKVGDREYFRINGQGFGDGALAEWVKTTWGFTVIIDPCRDPQPGPPIGMTPQNSCGPPRSGSRAGASAELLPSANLMLAARSRAVP